jgi:divalent metal cation (Fe/Co/Zn/Cd) transporter
VRELPRSLTATLMTPVDATQADGLRRRGLWLEYLTIGWNVIEAFIAVGAGIAAGSLALVAFGFDSTIEVFAAAVVVWQFRAELRGHADEAR